MKNTISISEAQALLKAGDSYDQLKVKCKELGIDETWADLFNLLDRNYMEVDLWANGVPADFINYDPKGWDPTEDGDPTTAFSKNEGDHTRMAVGQVFGKNESSNREV